MADPLARAAAFSRLVASPGPDPLIIAACRERALVTIGGSVAHAGLVSAVRAAIGAELPREPGGVVPAGHGWTIALGPAEWLYVAPARDGWAVERDLARVLALVGGQAIDVSHGRAMLRLGGAPARAVLAKGCPIDLSPRGLPSGRAAQTLFGKIGVLVHARERDAIELYVSRSYADALADGLLAAAREFGCRIGPAVID
ncbi:MAG: sarcosine oxidase subunit gamma [Proteobacteria bacterium]|nr:sarcosine oxidase subunit gamma [Pseudomonadota bacterium]